MARKKKLKIKQVQEKRVIISETIPKLSSSSSSGSSQSNSPEEKEVSELENDATQEEFVPTSSRSRSVAPVLSANQSSLETTTARAAPTQVSRSEAQAIDYGPKYSGNYSGSSGTSNYQSSQSSTQQSERATQISRGERPRAMPVLPMIERSQTVETRIARQAAETWRPVDDDKYSPVAPKFEQKKVRRKIG